MLKTKLQLNKGTRLTSGLFIGFSFLIAASVLFASSMYYDIDSETVMMGDSTQMTGQTVSIAPVGAVSLTAGAASVWKTTEGDLTVQAQGDLIASSSENLIFFSSGVERMKIASSTGYLGIGTSTPLALLSAEGNILLSGASRYINFNKATSTAGYGIRDNSGTLEYKNESGDWAAVSSGGELNNIWSTSSSVIYPTDTTNAVIFGGTATTSNVNFEVYGNTQLDGTLGVQGTTTLSDLIVNGTSTFATTVMAYLEVPRISDFTLEGKLTAGSVEIEGSYFDIDGGTIDGITALTVANSVDIGNYDLRSLSITADSLISGRVIFASTNGLLVDDSDMVFSDETLTVTQLDTTTSTISTAIITFIEGAQAYFSGAVILAGGLNMSGTNITSVGDISGDGAITLTSGGAGDLTFDAGSGSIITGTGDNLFVGGDIFSTSTPASIRKSGEQILREVIPIFGFDLPSQTSTTSYVTLTREVEDYPFAPAIDNTTRVHKIVIKYADATTTASSTWRVYNTTDSTADFTFTVPSTSSTSLEKGEVYIKTVTIPTDADDWQLDMITATADDTGTNTRIYQIFLTAYDQID